MKRKINLFDVILLLGVAVLGLGLYALVHQAPATPPDTPSELLADLRRNAQRYTDQEELAQETLYNITYTVLLEDISEEYLACIPALGEEIYDSYSVTSLGTLEQVEEETVDGHTDVTLTLSAFCRFQKTAVRTSADVVLAVGKEIYLQDAHWVYLGGGTITWISH